MFVFMQQFCVSLCAGYTVSKLKLGYKFQNLSGADPRSAIVFGTSKTCFQGFVLLIFLNVQ